MIRRARYILAAAGTAAILAGGMALAGAGPAFAGSLPSCAGGVNCTNSMAPAGGTAGYYGADDNHTHYKFVSTVTVATPQLFKLNGKKTVIGSTGVTLCDPNTGQVAQLSLFSPALGVYAVVWETGSFMTSAAEPCVQNGNVVLGPHFKFAPILIGAGISTNDKIQLQISYVGTGPNKNRVLFSACDITSSVCRQAGVRSPTRAFWEAGIGVATGAQRLTAPANNFLDSNAFNQVQCYSCAAAVPITSIAPVNPFNIGGLYEAQLINVSSQVTMSPNDSLSESTDGFSVWNGSTSA